MCSWKKHIFRTAANAADPLKPTFFDDFMVRPKKEKSETSKEQLKRKYLKTDLGKGHGQSMKKHKKSTPKRR